MNQHKTSVNNYNLLHNCRRLTYLLRMQFSVMQHGRKQQERGLVKLDWALSSSCKATSTSSNFMFLRFRLQLPRLFKLKYMDFYLLQIWHNFFRFKTPTSTRIAYSWLRRQGSSQSLQRQDVGKTGIYLQQYTPLLPSIQAG